MSSHEPCGIDVPVIATLLQVVSESIDHGGRSWLVPAGELRDFSVWLTPEALDALDHDEGCGADPYMWDDQLRKAGMLKRGKR